LPAFYARRDHEALVKTETQGKDIYESDLMTRLITGSVPYRRFIATDFENPPNVNVIPGRGLCAGYPRQRHSDKPPCCLFSARLRVRPIGKKGGHRPEYFNWASVTCMGTQTMSSCRKGRENAMMLAHKLPIAAAALSLAAMAFLAPAEARGLGGFRGGISGFHGGGTMRGFGHFRNPVVFMHPGPFRSPFLNRRGFVSRHQFFFRGRFADNRRFFFRGDRFEGPFAIGFVGAGYAGSAYDSAYATSPDDQSMTQTSPSYDSAYATSTETSPSYDGPYNVSGAPGRGCSLLIKVEKSGNQFVGRRIPLC
jgi:hypothetical protein